MAFPSAVAQRAASRNDDTRWLARLLRIEDTRHDEPAFVDSLLASQVPRRRARAALTVGRIGARAHLPVLRLRTTDADSTVAAAAWFALTLLRDSGAAPVAATLTHLAPTIAEQAVRLLGDIGDAGRPGIVAGLADSTLGGEVRGALLLAAAKLRPVPAPAIIPWLADADSDVAWRAAYALARGRSAAGVRPLLEVADSPVGSVREQVARGLSRALAADSLGDSALAVLRHLASDPQPRVRVNAVRALASYGSRASAGVVASLHDPDAGVRVTAAQSLGAVLDSSTSGWDAAFAADTALVFRIAVAEGAASHGVVVAGARSWRASPDWRRRAATVSLETHGVAVEATPRVRAWLADRDPRVRSVAASALATLIDSGSASDSARAGLRSSLRDADTFVRAAALSGLSRGASLVDLWLALEERSRSVRDRDADARLAFWPLADSALARAGSEIPDSVLSRLRAIPRPDDPLERLAASRIPHFTAWRDSTGTARPLAWYEARAREATARQARVARLETDRGVIEVTLFANDAPLTVYNFVTLANRHYFDGQRFHRVVPNFVVQAGDPRGDGNGGPGYAIRDEINPHPYLRGTLGMALSGPNTGGSQFFITHSPQPHLDGGYTVFGQLRSGADVLDRIVQGDRIDRIIIR